MAAFLALALGSAAIGGVEIDDVAQQNPVLAKSVTPIDDGAQRHRTFTDGADHALAAGLDALGDGDLALAREQLDIAHLAQIHTHRVVGPAVLLGLVRLGGSGSSSPRRNFLRRGVFGLLVFHHIDAHFREHRHGVLDLFGGKLILGQGGVQLVIGDVAPFLAPRHHLLDRGAHGIDDRTFRCIPLRLFTLGSLGFLRRHKNLPRPIYGRPRGPLPKFRCGAGPSPARRITSLADGPRPPHTLRSPPHRPRPHRPSF